jgi:hypothetical protein
MTNSTIKESDIFPRGFMRSLLVPIIIEQFLAFTIGLADTIMVSSAGEAAISGVSLVDQINILLIQIFAALATGGAVIVSQYIGRGEKQRAAYSGSHAADKRTGGAAGLSPPEGCGCLFADSSRIGVYGPVG